MRRLASRPLEISLLLWFGAALAGLGGCKSNPVGRPCFVQSVSDGGAAETVIGSPALECQSRICLHVASKTPDLCTADCSTDADCDTSPESPCQTGFSCMTPVVTGDFCCRKLCVCRDYLPGGVPPPEPEACDPTVAANECCNLTGRRDDPQQYPACQ